MVHNIEENQKDIDRLQKHLEQEPQSVVLAILEVLHYSSNQDFQNTYRLMELLELWHLKTINAAYERGIEDAAVNQVAELNKRHEAKKAKAVEEYEGRESQ
jgi:hypothetical protein